MATTARGTGTLTVWKFDSPDGADKAEATLLELQKEALISVHDAATVSWPADKKSPKTRQLNSLTGAGAAWGGMWGLLFGLIFFVPILGLAIGAGLGALSASMADVGIDDNFIKQVRSQVTPGTSALFVLSSDAVLDKCIEAFKGTGASLIQSNLSAEQEKKLHDAFGA